MVFYVYTKHKVIDLENARAMHFDLKDQNRN